MVTCLFWTPELNPLREPHPETLGLAERVAKWDFIRDVVWLGTPPPWWKGRSKPALWKNRREWLEAVRVAAEGEEHVFLAPGDAPFLREDLCREVWHRHQEFRADYTFTDGYPLGLCGEAVRCAALGAMCQAVPDDGAAPDREGVFSAILHEVNAFDIETVLSPSDLRGLRLGFFDGGPREKLLLDRWSERSRLPEPVFLEALQTDRVAQRTLPAYWKLQLTTTAIQTPVYSVKPEPGPELSPAEWPPLIKKVGTWMGGGVLMPGFWNEPSLFRGWEDLEAAAAEAGLSWVIETSGLGWREADWKALSSRPGKVTWIVELDAWDETLYKSIRGEGYTEAMSAVARLLELFPDKVYLQATRFEGNEDHIEMFYKKAKEMTGRVIIQQYNNLAGRLPNRAAVDLSPWKRHPCWHLQRGLHTMADGTVMPCHQFPGGGPAWGNIAREEPLEIWERGLEWMEAHNQGRYPAECVGCDEYYNFTF